jgi:hypothetical protein
MLLKFYLTSNSPKKLKSPGNMLAPEAGWAWGFGKVLAGGNNPLKLLREIFRKNG